MILTMLIVTAAVAASVGYLSARRRREGNGADLDPDDARRSTDDDDDDDEDSEPAPAPKNKAKPKPKEGPFEKLPLALGDVVLATGDERWLAGALVAREDGRVVCALFLAPEGTKHSAVAVFPPPRSEIYWMDPAEVISPEEPPATIELAGAAYRRIGRLPVTIERHGQGAPNIEGASIWASYEGGAREVAVVITGGGRAHAWQGRRLEEGDYDRLGAGGD